MFDFTFTKCDYSTIIDVQISKIKLKKACKFEKKTNG